MFDLISIKGAIGAVDGFYCDGVSVGLKKDDALDVAFIYSDTICDVEAIFTQNRFQAAPIKHFLKKGDFNTNFVLINAKNANAMTGEAGVADIDELLENLTKKFPMAINPIMSSTGVIGVRLPKEKIATAFDKFDLNSKNGENCANAIMTTDAYQKSVAFRVDLSDGGSFTIGAMAKGAGMINPSLATMLCFIVTDANIPKNEMKELLSECVEDTFNAISVDGDTSTNDTVMLLSNKKSGVYNKEAFKYALFEVMKKLALDIARDGEGAKKLVAFEVKNALNYEEASKAAKALSNSLLVKTALFGEDPNWGRIASTIGASRVESDETKLVISFDDVVVYDKGNIYFDKENELKAANVLKKSEFKISCDLGIGDGKFTAYGCDLGYEYVKINADYRT
ncbi:MAG: bifunctional glutamate N-acetyltransferase/amino-acid acetyltransferase ArgJ [Campylobacterales bacterium]|nr:bifunctional glutamate N-acetyltransferase/amino-acid acetyltransferase ArgJ [Campylobacterales bacterium]